jgi:deltex-like protein
VSAAYGNAHGDLEYDQEIYQETLRFEGFERRASRRQEEADAILARTLQEEEEEEDARIQAEQNARVEAESHMVREERERLIHQLLQIYSASPSSPAEPPVYSVPEDKRVAYEAPCALHGDAPIQNFALVSTTECGSSDICAVCYEQLSSGVAVSLRMCGHVFHLDCICEALEHQKGCPTCRRDVRTIPEGTSPSGTMFITRPAIGAAVVARPDAENPVVIKIEYKIPPGKQARYHGSPGRIYEGTEKCAYLPNTSQGNEILHRLVYAFSYGLLFRVASDGTVMWGSIPHLALLGEKEDDARRLACCSEGLDQLGIPRNPSQSPAWHSKLSKYCVRKKR